MSQSLTTTLSLLLMAAQAKAHEFEYRVHEVIKNLMDLMDWSDERRADLYALLVESVTPEDGMLAVEQKVSRALVKNTERFYG